MNFRISSTDYVAVAATVIVSSPIVMFCCLLLVMHSARCIFMLQPTGSGGLGVSHTVTFSPSVIRNLD
jgi:hypothetical protein